MAPSFSSKQSLSIKIAEIRTFDFGMPVLENEIDPGGTAHYKIPVRNTGNTDLILAIDLPKETRGGPAGKTTGARQGETLSSGWSIESSTDKLIVPYNSTVEFTVELGSPKYSEAEHVESVPINVLVTEPTGVPVVPEISNACILNATVTQYYDFNFESLTGNTEVSAGKNKWLEFEVTNTGNGWDTFSFDAITPPSWSFSFTDLELTIPAFDTADVKIKINVPSSETAGKFDIAVTASSLGDPTKTCGERLELELVQRYDIKMTAEKAIVVVAAGGTIVVPLHLVNNGNGDDTVTLKSNWFEGFVHFTESKVLVTRL
jgi:hypothetical protein